MAAEPGLQATYYDNQDLTVPVVTRVDPSLNFNWGSGSPDAAIAPDYFSARWTATLRPRHSETYTLYVTTDDGVRVWLDGRLVVDAWIAKSSSTLSANVPLVAGAAHQLRVEYFELAGQASARLEWSSQSQVREVVPGSCLDAVAVAPIQPTQVAAAFVPAGTALSWNMSSVDVTSFAIERQDVTGVFVPLGAVAGTAREFVDAATPVAGVPVNYRVRAVNAAGASAWVAVQALLPTGADATGLLATYWDNIDFTGTWMQRIDPTIDFAWGARSPAPQLGVDTFSVRWTGFLSPPTTGLYTLYATTDDGVRVWIDGTMVISAWVDRAATTSTAVIPLTAGQQHAIRMDFYEQAGDATARLEWSGPEVERMVIPVGRMHAGPVPPQTPTRLVAATTSLATAPICLAWQAVDADQAAFAIERAVDDGPFAAVAEVSGTVRTWDDATAPVGGMLRYRIRGVSSQGAGGWAQVDATLPPLATTPGYWATYWDNRDFTGTWLKRLDPLIDFSWASSAPAPHIAADTFSVRWTGAVIPVASGSFTFHATSDDGVRLWVDEALVIDSWIYRSAATSTGTAELTAGAVHQIRMEFFEGAGNATARLEWSGPGVARALVPAIQFASSVAPSITVAAHATPDPVTGSSATVAVTAADDGPSSALTYTWSASGPGQVTFTPNSSNAAQQAQASFQAAGSYELTVTVRDAGGLSTTSMVPVTVVPTATRVVITPAEVEIPAGTSQTFTARLLDQFGAVLAPPATVAWAVSGGGGIVSTGVTTADFTAAGCGGVGQHTVTGSVAGCSGTATVVVSTVGAMPSIRPPFTASGTVGVPFSYTIKACNGPTGFAATNLPAGLSVDAVTGVISGMPQAAGATTATVQASNAHGTGTASLAITIAIGTPVITWADPAPIPAGTLLSASQLDATASVPGSFVYTPAVGTDLPAGSHQLSVAFTPADTVNYLPATATTTLVVQAQVPVIAWAVPAPIVYGDALTAAQLNATSTVPGTWAYQPESGIILEAGTHPLTVVFTPTDLTRYATATAEVSLVVQQRVPAITWPTPASITAGTALSASQLHASAGSGIGHPVDGEFTYDPPLGTIMPAGTHVLSVTFTPVDTLNFRQVTASVALVVTSGGGGLPPAAPIVILAISDGLTGDEQATVDGLDTWLTRNTQITVSITTTITDGAELVGTQLVASAGTAEQTGPNTWTLKNLPEGRIDLSATATVRKNDQEGTGITAQNRSLLVDRTAPTVMLCEPGASDGSRPLGVGLIADGAQPLLLSLAADAANLRTLGWRCWSVAGLDIPVRISDASGLRTSVAPVAKVGAGDLTATPGATASDGTTIISLTGFASLPEAVTPDPASLVLTATAGMQPLHVQLEDRCGNPLDVDLCSVWKKTTVGKAAFGYIPRNDNAFPTTVGVVGIHDQVSLAPVYLLATPADIIAVDQYAVSGAQSMYQGSAMRLGPGASWGNLAGQGPVLWQLQGVQANESGDIVAGVILRDALGNQTGLGVNPDRLQTAQRTVWTSPPLPPDGPDVYDIEIPYREVPEWFLWSGSYPGSADYQSIPYWWPEVALPYFSDYDNVSRERSHPFSPINWFREQVFRAKEGSVRDLVTVMQMLDLSSTEQPITGAKFFVSDSGYAVSPSIDVALGSESIKRQYGVVTVFPDYQETAAALDPGTATLYGFSYRSTTSLRSDAPVASDAVEESWYGAWAGRHGDVRVVVCAQERRVTQVEGDVSASMALWNPIVDRAVPLVKSLPPSWVTTPVIVNVPSDGTSGRVTFADATAAAQNIGSGSADTLAIPLTRATPPGYAQVQWEKRPSAWQHAGYRGLNLVKVVNDVVVAGGDQWLHLDGGFISRLSANNPTLPSTGSVRLLESQRRTWAEPRLQGMHASSAGLSVLSVWIDELEADAQSDLTAVASLADGPEALDVTHRILLRDWEIRSALRVALPNTPAQILSGYANQHASWIPSNPIWSYWSAAMRCTDVKRA